RPLLLSSKPAGAASLAWGGGAGGGVSLSLFFFPATTNAAKEIATASMMTTNVAARLLICHLRCERLVRRRNLAGNGTRTSAAYDVMLCLAGACFNALSVVELRHCAQNRRSHVRVIDEQMSGNPTPRKRGERAARESKAVRCPAPGPGFPAPPPDAQSVAVGDALAVEHAQQRRPFLVQLGTARPLELPISLLRGPLRDDADVHAAAGERIDLDLAGAIEVVHQLEGFAHRAAEREQPVVAQDHGLRVRAEVARQAAALVQLQGDAF